MNNLKGIFRNYETEDAEITKHEANHKEISKEFPVGRSYLLCGSRVCLVRAIHGHVRGKIRLILGR